MRDTLGKLYLALQLMKKTCTQVKGNHWYIINPDKNFLGPYFAIEIAFIIHIGMVKPQDVLLNHSTQKQYYLKNHYFLKQWILTDLTTQQRLYRGLVKKTNAFREALGLPKESEFPGWLLTKEQKRAFNLLGLTPLSSIKQLKKQHHKLARHCHPDMGGQDKKMLEINWAVGIVRRVLPGSYVH